MPKTVNSNHCLVLFNPYIGPYQVLPLRVRVVLVAMGMKGYSAYRKLQHYRNLNIRLFSVNLGHSLVWSYHSAVKQSVYSTAPADSTIYERDKNYKKCLKS